MIDADTLSIAAQYLKHECQKHGLCGRIEVNEIGLNVEVNYFGPKYKVSYSNGIVYAELCADNFSILNHTIDKVVSGVVRKRSEWI